LDSCSISFTPTAARCTTALQRRLWFRDTARSGGGRPASEGVAFAAARNHFGGSFAGRLVVTGHRRVAS
jgi:hypothetical protein